MSFKCRILNRVEEVVKGRSSCLCPLMGHVAQIRFYDGKVHCFKIFSFIKTLRIHEGDDPYW